MRLAAISKAEAKAYFKKYSAYRGQFDFAIGVKEGTKLHGVIALNADGCVFSLGHIQTDGNAHIGSLLYGGAWRSAKAMGYTHVKI